MSYRALFVKGSFLCLSASLVSFYDFCNFGGIVGYTKGTTLTVDNCYVGGTLSAPENVGAIVGYAETSTTATNNRYSVTGAAAAVGTALDGMLTESGNSALAETEVSEYATASLVAKKLGWDETVWDLSGENPVLK